MQDISILGSDNSKSNSNQKKIFGVIGYALPLVAVLIILLMIFLIVSNFALSGIGKISWEFLTQDPQNMNTEGGIFPAIVGTFLLVLIMAIVGVPVGTITAIYLSEYASPNSKFAKIIRFAVNTLAGVPSIVFGLFGLGFFIQTVGASIDNYKWKSLRQDMVTAVGGVEKSYAKGELISKLNSIDSIKYSPVISEVNNFDVIENQTYKTFEYDKYLAEKKMLKWGKPALIWAALTLALLTLPVVIVSVEEALRAVPKEIKEASLALGATKWTTIRKIILPTAMSGILTGSILAVSRGAGEVAPILLTGVVYSQQELPKSLSDQFMNLGYHLYILATQSPDVEKTITIQYATTLVLLALTLILNFIAIIIRARINRKMIRG